MQNEASNTKILTTALIPLQNITVDTNEMHPKLTLQLTLNQRKL